MNKNTKMSVDELRQWWAAQQSMMGLSTPSEILIAHHVLINNLFDVVVDQAARIEALEGKIGGNSDPMQD